MKTFKYNELTPQAQLIARLDLFDTLQDVEMFDQASPLSANVELIEKMASSDFYNYEFNGEVVYA
jgi:hypothetical protein